MGVGNDQALWVPDCAGPAASSSVLDLDKAAVDAFNGIRKAGVQFR
jgi:hypothetical protein